VLRYTHIFLRLDLAETSQLISFNHHIYNLPRRLDRK
jgi:hypothetical protein